MSIQNIVVATYDTHEAAEAAVNELQKAGFDMRQLSILGKGMENEQHIVGYYNAPERAAFWGKYGAFWGGLFGLLFGSAMFYGARSWSLVRLGTLGGMDYGRD